MRRFGPGSSDEKALTEESIEAFFIHKLSLLLDQKGDRVWRQDRIISKHNDNIARASKHKSEESKEPAEADVVQMNSNEISL